MSTLTKRNLTNCPLCGDQLAIERTAFFKVVTIEHGLPIAVHSEDGVGEIELHCQQHTQAEILSAIRRSSLTDQVHDVLIQAGVGQYLSVKELGRLVSNTRNGLVDNECVRVSVDALYQQGKVWQSIIDGELCVRGAAR